MNTSWQGEIRFAGYSDSSRGGPKVTFGLADRADLEHFVGLEGRRFMAVFVEIADDETPAVPQEPEAPTTPAPVVGPLCKWVAIRCGEASFQRWLRVSDEAAAKDLVLQVCGVASRKALDTDPDAAAIFHAKIRQPYAAWLQSQAVPA